MGNVVKTTEMLSKMLWVMLSRQQKCCEQCCGGCYGDVVKITLKPT
jgi:hypothetical protein